MLGLWGVDSTGEEVKCASCNCNDTQTTLAEVELKCELVFKGLHIQKLAKNVIHRIIITFL